jgi:hypothetical protein
MMQLMRRHSRLFVRRACLSALFCVSLTLSADGMRLGAASSAHACPSVAQAAAYQCLQCPRGTMLRRLRGPSSQRGYSVDVELSTAISQFVLPTPCCSRHPAPRTLRVLPASAATDSSAAACSQRQWLRRVARGVVRPQGRLPRRRGGGSRRGQQQRQHWQRVRPHLPPSLADHLKPVHAGHVLCPQASWHATVHPQARACVRPRITCVRGQPRRVCQPPPRVSAAAAPRVQAGAALGVAARVPVAALPRPRRGAPHHRARGAAHDALACRQRQGGRRGACPRPLPGYHARHASAHRAASPLLAARPERRADACASALHAAVARSRSGRCEAAGEACASTCCWLVTPSRRGSRWLRSQHSISPAQHALHTSRRACRCARATACSSGGTKTRSCQRCRRASRPGCACRSPSRRTCRYCATAWGRCTSRTWTPTAACAPCSCTSPVRVLVACASARTARVPLPRAARTHGTTSACRGRSSIADLPELRAVVSMLSSAAAQQSTAQAVSGPLTLRAAPRRRGGGRRDRVPPHQRLALAARRHVYAAPRRGDALLFYSLPPSTEAHPDAPGEVDEFSMHTGCPPEEGLKWTATFWARPCTPYHAMPSRAPCCLACRTCRRSVDKALPWHVPSWGRRQGTAVHSLPAGQQRRPSLRLTAPARGRRCTRSPSGPRRTASSSARRCQTPRSAPTTTSAAMRGQARPRAAGMRNVIGCAWHT